jgi:hypothetical protein
VETVLHSFNFNGKDGYTPGATTFSGTGKILGSTQSGGTSTACGTTSGLPNGCGTVFQITLP